MYTYIINIFNYTSTYTSPSDAIFQWEIGGPSFPTRTRWTSIEARDLDPDSDPVELAHVFQRNAGKMLGKCWENAGKMDEHGVKIWILWD